VGVLAKLEALERDLRLVVEQSGNTLAPTLGRLRIGWNKRQADGLQRSLDWI
jgi:hypothetical protein